MNAAARLVHQRLFTRRLSLGLQLSHTQIMLMSLALFVLISSLGLIYTTHLSRLLNASIQQQAIEQNHLQVVRGQFLLERSTLMAQAQTQAFAEKELHMFVPGFKSITIIHES